jgi:hypothetical protein
MAAAACLQAGHVLIAFLTPITRIAFPMSSNPADGKPPLPDIQALDVTLRRETVQVGRWDSVSWKLEAVRIADRGATAQPPMVDGDRVTHHGILLRLYRDQVDDYHYNMQGTSPRLFVVCTVDPADGSHVPSHATLSQLEAVDYMETENEVLSCPLEGEVRDWLEAWTLLSPVPAPEGRKKRRHRSAPSE